MSLTSIDPNDIGRRNVISAAKVPLLQAILQVLHEQRTYWPLSVRQIHYRLLNIKPLLHADKPDSAYRNDKASYRAAIDICARGRLEGRIPWNSIDDATRPVQLNAGFPTAESFCKDHLDYFLTGYWRNLLQSQTDHIEIVAEKLTVQTILQDVAQRYTMPMTISRGMNTLSPKKAILNRYRASKKIGLKLLVVTDLDPAGETIADDLVKSFKRDFRVHHIEAFKVALTFNQIEEFGLQPSMDAKESSPTYQSFVDRHGITEAYELEAMNPADLSDVLRDAIEVVLDMHAFQMELDREEADKERIADMRLQTTEFFRSLNDKWNDEG